MTTSRVAELLRKPGDPQRATFLELFFDLVFVLAFTQLSHGLIQHLDWAGAFRTLLVISIMGGSLVMAAALPGAFGDTGLVFAVVYFAIQLGRSIFLPHGTTRGLLWTLAVAVEYGAFVLHYPTPGLGRSRESELPVVAEHLSERYRQFFIVALGELILLTGLAVTGTGFTTDRTAAIVVSFATTVLLWRIYIHRAGQLLPAAIAAVPDPDRLARSASYAHLVMVAGIVVTAVGDQLVIVQPLGQTRPAWIAVILGGPALFMAGRALLEYEVFKRVPRDRPVALFVLAAMSPAMLLVPPLLVAVAATLVLALNAVSDATRARRRPPSHRGHQADHRDG
ncbi:low temperature requirement protein A [Micromonospora sp. 4G57]|uniref:Low temperature requirement protein A n=1 Tax=Micromonospora sicca TaxID=2202420 RepID=A0ABU5JCU1_9ACTN|nr:MULTISPECIES: low temperature requirement protein A [unclassified Micromonospora]MDZ5441673.1 low temperature requirement protein A [Micromonospora sp. 4G57]MDZ5490234.1 low temperature requirement protein A [Micromonospora sp. 4G53]